MKVVENSLQNAQNCIILKKQIRQRLAALLATYIQNPRNEKVGPPTLRNPAYAPVKDKDERIFVRYLLYY